jgi:hypothetical protein
MGFESTHHQTYDTELSAIPIHYAHMRPAVSRQCEKGRRNRVMGNLYFVIWGYPKSTEL